VGFGRAGLDRGRTGAGLGVKRGHSLDQHTVGLGKPVRHRAVDIQHAGQAPGDGERDNDFGARGAVAGDVPIEEVHVGHHDRFLAGGRSAAYAAAERDAGAGRLALKRPDNEGIPPQKVEAGPVDLRQAQEKPRRGIGGKGDRVGFPGEEGAEF